MPKLSDAINEAIDLAGRTGVQVKASVSNMGVVIFQVPTRRNLPVSINVPVEVVTEVTPDELLARLYEMAYRYGERI